MLEGKPMPQDHPRRKHGWYMTDLLTDMATDFLEERPVECVECQPSGQMS